MSLLRQHITEVQKLCAGHKVRKLYAFGSVITDDFNASSDIDLIVDFEDMDVLSYADNYFDLKFSLQDIFHRPIDLLEESALKNPFFIQSVSKSRQLVYEQ